MRATQSGFTLVEVLVGVMIGLIGMLVITQVYLTGENFNRSTLGEGGAQSNGLIALYTIERDVRLAGYGLNSAGALGCGNIYWYYDPNYSGNIAGGTLPNIQLAPVVITADTVTPSNPDRITVMYSRDAERMMPTIISGFNASSSEVSVDGTEGFEDGDLVLLVGSGGCTLGRITQVQEGPRKLQLNPGASGKENPPAWGSFPTTYVSGNSILNLGDPVIHAYFIGNDKLRVSDSPFTPGAAGVAPVSDMVDGIVDMRALYGKDDGGGGGTANDFQVDTWNNTTPATSAGWLQVLAVRIGILARIGTYEKPTSGTNCDATTTAPTWSGGNFPAIDIATPTSQDRCYRYRVFETTVPLRNMIWRPT
jgi:type IV pilus assembly protein PilW